MKIALSIGLPIVGAAMILPMLTFIQVFATNIPVIITLGSQSKTTDAFSPNPVNAKVGDTVTWTNKDSTPHTVTSGSNATPDGRFDSSPDFRQLLIPEGTFSHTFEEAGEYPYYCGLHPNMLGTVLVTAEFSGNGENSMNPIIFPVIAASILAASIAAIIGYTRLAKKKAGFSDRA